MTHTIEHALSPEKCDCDPHSITNCVICEKRLDHTPYLDTCGKECFKKLLSYQRRIRVLKESTEDVLEDIRKDLP